MVEERIWDCFEQQRTNDDIQQIQAKLFKKDLEHTFSDTDVI